MKYIMEELFIQVNNIMTYTNLQFHYMTKKVFIKCQKHYDRTIDLIKSIVMYNGFIFIPDENPEFEGNTLQFKMNLKDVVLKPNHIKYINFY